MARQSRGRVRNNTSGGGGWGRRGGKEALEQAKQERKAAANRRNYGPQEFGLDRGDVREIVFLDDSLDDMFYVHRHDWYKPSAKPPVQKFLCTRQFEECPVCAEYERDPKGPFGPSAFTIMSSIIEFVDPDEDEPLYTTKKDEDVFHAKRLFAMKATQSEEYERIFQIVQEKHGTLRGLVLLVQRGEGDQSARIGKPVMFDSGEMYYMLSEDELIDDFGHDAIKGDDGKTLKPADDDIKPFDYTKLFPEPNAADLAEQAGVPLTPGSAADNRRARGDDDDEDEAPRSRSRSRKRNRGSSDEGDAPARTSRGRRRGRAAEAEQEEDQREEEDEREEEDDAPRTRTRTRTRSRSRSRSEEQEEDSPPPRTRTRTRRGRAASADDTEIPM